VGLAVTKLGKRAPLAVMSLAVLTASGLAAIAMLAAREKRDDEGIDERIAESFPASDPPWQP